ncbi:MAG: hypothetical protein WBC33_02520 [Conexibacter sp.]
MRRIDGDRAEQEQQSAELAPDGLLPAWLGERQRYCWADDRNESHRRNRGGSSPHLVGRYRDTSDRSTLPRYVAAKRYAPGDRAGDEERRLLRRLDDNVFVVPLHDHGYVKLRDGTLWVLTPWMSGGSLDLALKRGGRMGAARVSDLANDLLGSIERAHGRGIALGDIACENLFLSSPDDNAYVVIGDLDHGKDVGVPSTDATGRPAYRPGEPCSAAEVDAYALGLVLWEMLAGRRIYEFADRAGDDPHAVRREVLTLLHDVPERFRPVIAVLLDAPKRTAKAAIQDAKRALGAADVVTTPRRTRATDPRPRPPRRRRRAALRQTGLVAIAAGSVAIALSAWALIDRDDKPPGRTAPNLDVTATYRDVTSSVTLLNALATAQRRELRRLQVADAALVRLVHRRLDRAVPCRPDDALPSHAVARVRCEIAGGPVTYTRLANEHATHRAFARRNAHTTPWPSDGPCAAISWWDRWQRTTNAGESAHGDVAFRVDGPLAAVRWTYPDRRVLAEATGPTRSLARICASWYFSG